MTRSLIAIAVALGLGLAASADAADRAEEGLDLRALKAAPLECMRIQLKELPDATAFCSTTVQRLANAVLESPTQAWVIKTQAQGPVVAVVRARTLSSADQHAIGVAFESATRCIWERDRRVVHVGDDYVALYNTTFHGEPQPVVSVLAPFAAKQEFGDGSGGIGACKAI